MNSFYAGLITLAILAVTVFFILVLVELRTAIKALKEFLQTTESTLKPTLLEFQEYLKVARSVTENVNTVTEDVRVLSGSVREIGENVRGVSRGMKLIGDLVEGQGSIAAMKVAGLRAGIRAASQVVLENLLRRKNS
jgi:uncharacterized protein YoxC